MSAETYDASRDKRKIIYKLIIDERLKGFMLSILKNLSDKQIEDIWLVLNGVYEMITENKLIEN